MSIFPQAGHAARVEQEQARGRRGILHGGSVYGCVFTGGADNDTFSFARLKRPTGPGLLKLLAAIHVLIWVVLKGAALTVRELLRTVVELAQHPRERREVWQWMAIRIGFSVWIRQLFTLAVSRDVYAGIPAIYVNYLDYDVAAHAFRPRSPRAFRSLNRIDRAIRQILRVVWPIPEHHYDVFILSDHGQVACLPYGQFSGGVPLERALFNEVIAPGRSHAATVASSPTGLGHGVRAYGVGGQRGLRRLLQPLEGRRDGGSPGADQEREVYEQGESVSSRPARTHFST